MPAVDPHTPDLFAAQPSGLPAREALADGALLLRGRALPLAENFLAEVGRLTALAPFRQMQVASGQTMSVAMSNCGELGWISDRQGYRYAPLDPLSGRPWPAMPDVWRAFAAEVAAEAGFADFEPDACLINRYAPGARMGLHQDRDEAELAAPIVSLSFGLPATFLFGGLRRADPARRLTLLHGDVLVWGGPSRLRYHGVAPLKAAAPGTAPADCRINLTFRRAAPAASRQADLR